MSRPKTFRCSECGASYKEAPPWLRVPEPGNHVCVRHPDAWGVEWRMPMIAAYHLATAELRRGGDLVAFAEVFPEQDLIGFSRADLALACSLALRWPPHDAYDGPQARPEDLYGVNRSD